MKKLLTLLLVLASLGVMADAIDDTFGPGQGDFDFDRFDNQAVLRHILGDAQVACQGGLCTLSSVTTRNHGFSVSFNAGVGQNNNNYGNGGTVIVTGQDDYGTNGTCNDCPSYGMTISYNAGKCTQEVNVPKSVYIAVNRYMYGLMTEEGGTRRGFTPADEAMIMFYTTIMKQANGCKNQ
jgi:hypothetical protein